MVWPANLSNTLFQYSTDQVTADRTTGRHRSGIQNDSFRRRNTYVVDSVVTALCPDICASRGECADQITEYKELGSTAIRQCRGFSTILHPLRHRVQSTPPLAPQEPIAMGGGGAGFAVCVPQDTVRDFQFL